MELRQLGKTDIRITPVILGTWAIGGWMWGGTDEKKGIAAIQHSIDKGISTIDTAPAYGAGLSEILVGKAVKGRRDKVIIATKCGLRWEEGRPINALGTDFKPVRNLKPESIVYECEQSLKRLKTDVIDLYQFHWPDPNTPIEASWEAMVKLKEQGKVRAIGVCNYSVDQLKTAHAVHRVDSVQPPYSLIRRGIEKDLIPYCQEHGISVIVYSSMERGLLTGKYKPGHHFPPGDHRGDKETFSPEFLRKADAALDKLQPIAAKHHATLSQIIINCTMHRPGITAALVGARDPAQAEENAAAASLKLSDAELKVVADALADPALQRPVHD